jgi:cell division protein FtsQ
MKTKQLILKILFVSFWVCFGAGMLVLLIAAIGKENKKFFNDYIISIKGSEDNLFVDKNDIVQILKNETGAEIRDLKFTEINLRQLEQVLKSNVWISDAQLWIDNKNLLNVVVTGREPVARIFSSHNNSFYIDSNEIRMPLSEKVSARVPVFTNFQEKKSINAKDSMLIKDIKNIALFIKNSSFWMSQVSQINIDETGDFEMIPVVGNHLVKLGNGDDLEQKFNRLMSLYKQVLAKTGFDFYSSIDVQYAGQVIGTKRGMEKNIVDSVRLRINVENILNQSKQNKNDSSEVMMPLNNEKKSVSDSAKKIEDSKNEMKPKAVMPTKNN